MAVARSQLEHALAYLQQGWKLVMMPTGSKGPTGEAAMGWNSPSALIDSPEKAVARLAHGPQNMGLVHQPSGTVSIDVDDEAWARHILEQFGLDYDAIIAAGMRIKSREGRDKVVFAQAPDLPLVKVTWPKQNATGPTDLFTIIEFRAGPNQDVLPPSKHPDGHHYSWWPGTAPWDFAERGGLPTMPVELLQFWRALADPSTGLREEIKNLCPWRPAHERKRPPQRARTVSGDHQNVIGQFNAARSVEQLLEEGGYKKRAKRWLAPSSSTCIPGVVIFDDKCYSHHGSDLLADGYAHDAFDLHCMLVHNGNLQAALDDAASQLGIDRHAKPAEPPDMVIDMEAVRAAQKARRETAAMRQPAAEPHQASQAAEVLTIHETRKEAPPAEAGVPDHLLKPPGILGKAVEWMLQTAQHPQPLLSVAAALSAFGAVLGHKVASPTNLRTNLMLVGVAGTSMGKDHPRKAVKVLLRAAGMADNIGGEEIASGPALHARLGRVGNSIFMLDEFGLKLAGWTGERAASHQKAIKDTLLTMFSSAGSIVEGTEYSDSKMRPRQDLLYPCLNLFATTTAETLWPALSGADVTSGLMNRLLVVSAPEARPGWQKRAMLGEPPAALVEWIQAVRQAGNGLVGTASTPCQVQMSGMAETLFDRFYEWSLARCDSLAGQEGRETLAPLWGRANEQAIKVALILACTREANAEQAREALTTQSVEVDMTSAQWAIDFVKHCLSHMEEQVATQVGDSEFDRQVQEAARVIKAAGVQGRTLAELCRYSRRFKSLEGRQQDAVLEALRRREAVFSIEMRASRTSHKTRKAIVHTSFKEDVDRLVADMQAG